MTNSSLSTRHLVDVAMGRTPADLVIRDGRWMCVQSGEIVPHTDVAVAGEHFAYVGPDASHAIGEKTRVIEAHGRYLAPGLLDAHMHVESGMVTVTEFVRAVIPHGTTGMFIDPHEIANVFGLRGVRLMVDEAAGQPIHVWVQVPSCVPSAPGLETPGAAITPADVAEAMTWPGVIGLGEMMNFPGVFLSDEAMHAEMAATRAANKVIGGHYAAPDLGLPFHGYAAGGPEDDHEGTRAEDAVARIRQGMKVMLRHGSAWHDVAEQVRAVTEHGLDSRHFLLCTDDSHSATLVHEGHVNRALRVAIANGIPPLVAVQMASLNVAEHFGVARQVGQIAPGRYADLLLIEDLPQFRPDVVVAKGQIAAEAGRLKLGLHPFAYPDWARHSVKLARALEEKDFRLPRPPGPLLPGRQVKAHVIGVIENQAPTRHLLMDVAWEGDDVLLKDGLAKVALVERHHGSGRIQTGLVHGFGFDVPCGIASTVAHDCHQMIVAGTDGSCMAQAANRLAETGGGQVVVRHGQVIGEVALPIGGLMSDERAEFVARKAASVLYGFSACGCTLNNPNMQLSLLALVVIPELRISDLGLVDVQKFRLISVF
ncbi:MAG: adenine deaminase [Chloroflexota bacterium]